MELSVVSSGFTDITAIGFSSSRRVAVLAEKSGKLTLLDLLRQDDDGTYESRPIGSGYADPTNVVINGNQVIVADADGLWSASINHADRASATAFANQPGALRGMALVTDANASALAVLDSTNGPRLDIYTLGNTPGASVRTVVPALAGAFDLAALPAEIDPNNHTVQVLSAVQGGTTVQLVDLSVGTVRTLTPNPLAFSGRITAVAPKWSLVAAPNGSPAVVGDGTIRTLSSLAGVADAIRAVTFVENSGVLFTTGTQVMQTTLPLGIVDPVLLTIDDEAMFIGGYTAVRADTTGSGLSFDDVELSVENQDLGAVSPSKDETFDPAAPHLLVTGGWRTGRSIVTARNKATGETVGRVEFEITDRWPDTNEGPSYSVTGELRAPIVHAAWGGGDNGPQNIKAIEIPSTWRVAIVPIDTSSRRFPTGNDLKTIRDDWRDAMVNGITVGGVKRSVIDYYKETSYGKLTMSLVGNDIADVVSAAGSWDDYFELETKEDAANPGTMLPRRWNPKPDTWRAFASALEVANAANAAASPPKPPVVNLLNTDAVVFVVRTLNRPDTSISPPTSTSIGRFVWPQQTTPDYKPKGSDRAMPMLMMPEDWTQVDKSNRAIYATLIHELGHTLGLPDLYITDWMNQGLDQFALRDWDPMAREKDLPQFSLPIRMALGWIDAKEVLSFNFANNGGGAVLATPTIYALEQTTIPADSLRGVEIRIAEGRNYYFEYRNGIAGAIGDTALPKPKVVMGTDMVSPEGAQNYDVRPMVMRLGDDHDGIDDSDGKLTQGAFLGVGQNYKEPDFTEGAPKDFVATVQAVYDDRADLQIRYNSQVTPELSIRPWPNGDKQWQSPDILIENAKSDADNAWLNVPWGGNPNRVYATVKNHGGLEAKDVVAYFSIKNLTTNAADSPPATLEPLGKSKAVTIKPNDVGKLELEKPWVAPSSGHYCITVDIPLYEDATDPAIHEHSDRDNFAQSNYDKFWSESGSPSARKRFTIKLENPTDDTAVIFPAVRQSTPFYRTYVEHSWVRLPAQQTREIQVMTECLDGDPVWATFIDANRSAMWEMSNVLDVSGRVHGVCSASCTGGASLEIRSGRGTEIRDIAFYAEPGVLGTVRRGDGSLADHGTILLVARYEDEPVEDQRTAYSNVQNDGSFFVYMQDLERGMLVSLHYLGGFGLAPCETREMVFDPN